MASPASVRFDLEDRLLAFSVGILRLSERLHKTRAANYIADQLLRASLSPLLNHGEAQGAESSRDFVHKLSICLKELNESKRCLRIVVAVPLADSQAEAKELLAECEELVKIFGASIQTVKRKRKGT